MGLSTIDPFDLRDSPRIAWYLHQLLRWAGASIESIASAEAGEEWRESSRLILLKELCREPTFDPDEHVDWQSCDRGTVPETHSMKPFCAPTGRQRKVFSLRSNPDAVRIWSHLSINWMASSSWRKSSPCLYSSRRFCGCTSGDTTSTLTLNWISTF